MQGIDWQAWQFALSVVQLIGVVLVGIYAWWTNRSKATQGAIDRLERRLIRLEEDMRHQPNRTELNALSDRMGLLHADFQEMVGSFRGVQRAVDLIHQHLLDRSAK